MINNISKWMGKISNRWTFLFFLVGEVFFNAFLLPRAQTAIESLSGGVGPLDLTFAPSANQIFSSIVAYGPEGRALYRTVDLTTDVLYPITYSFFFSIVLTLLLNQSLPENNNKRFLNLLPFGALIFDFLENIGVVTLLTVFPAQPIGVALFLTTANALKWIFAGASIFSIIYALILKVIPRKG